MAQRRSNSREDKKEWNNQSSIFAKADLSVSDKEAFTNWMTSRTEKLSDALTAVTQDLWRVSFKVDVNNNCYMTSFTQQDFKDKNAGIVLTSRSDDLEEAFWMSLYKIYVLWENQRLPTEVDGQRWG